jgi:hypothetical protein
MKRKILASILAFALSMQPSAVLLAEDFAGAMAYEVESSENTVQEGAAQAQSLETSDGQESAQGGAEVQTPEAEQQMQQPTNSQKEGSQSTEEQLTESQKEGSQSTEEQQVESQKEGSQSTEEQLTEAQTGEVQPTLSGESSSAETEKAGQDSTSQESEDFADEFLVGAELQEALEESEEDPSEATEDYGIEMASEFEVQTASSVVASGKCGDSLTWTLDGDGKLTISGKGDWYNHDDISWKSKKNNVRKIVIHNGVSRIPEYMFANFENVTNISIPNSVTSIGDYVFDGCTSLTDIVIPSSVMNIGDYAFRCCKKLKSIQLPEGLKTISYYMFYQCESLASITIPDSVITIMSEAFCGCENLVKLNIPNSVTSIGEYAFCGCENLVKLNIPNSVTTIQDSAFRGCTSLTDLIIPSSVMSIGSIVFDGCTKLKSIQLPEGLKTISHSMFYQCESLTSITIPDSVTTIESLAFYSCDSLKELNIPNSVTSIKSGAFTACRGLEKITIPNSVTSIDEQAFSSPYPTIYGYTGSVAETYAKDYNISFKALSNTAAQPKNLKAESIGNNSIEISWNALTAVDGYCVYRKNSSGWKKIATVNSNSYVDTGLTSGTTYTYTVRSYIGSSFSTYDKDGVKAVAGTGNKVSLLQPHNLKAESSGTDHVSISWDSVAGAEGYRIYRKVSDEAWYLIGTTTENSYIDTEVDIRREYHYTVRAYKGKSISTYDTTGVGVTFLAEIDADHKGSCGKNLIWEIDYYGVMTIRGSGEMDTCPEWNEKEGEIKEVIIQNGVTSIGDEAFLSCRNLVRVSIPASVTKIGKNVFTNCGKMTEILVDSANQYFCSQNGILFSKDKKRLIKYPEGINGVWYKVPEGVTEIGEHAFYGTSINEIGLPQSVITIGDAAFAGSLLGYCPALSNVVTIGKNAFRYCDISYVTIPNTVLSVGDGAFSCSNAIKADLINVNNKLAMGEAVFNTNSTIVGIQGSIAESYAKKCGYKFQTVTVKNGKCGDNLTWTYDEYNKKLHISGTGAMWDNPSWENIDRSKIYDIELDEGVTSIGNNAFKQCTNIWDVKIPGSVQTIGNYAFAECEKLVVITLSEGLKTIGEGAFSNCKILGSGFEENYAALLYRDIVLPTSVTSIGARAFKGCTGMVRITIKNAKATIGANAISTTIWGYSGSTAETYAKSKKLTFKSLDDNPAWVENLKAESMGSDSIRISWSKLSGVDGYRIYRKSGTSWKNVGSITTTSFIDSGLNTGTKYTYIVRAYKGKILGGYNRSGVSATPVLAQPAKLSVENIGSGTNRISWNSVSEAEGYYVYRKNGTKWTRIGTVKRTFYTDTGLIKNHAYTYTVRAYKGSGQSSYDKNGVTVITGMATGNLTQGTCGNKLVWTLDRYGMLVISGTGEMSDSPAWDGKKDRIEKVYIENGVTSIGKKAFASCTNLTEVIISESVNEIGEAAFQECTSLVYISIPKSISNITTSMFSGCMALKGLVLPESVMSVGKQAFKGCSALASVTIPSSVTEIGSDAFSDCKQLTIYGTAGSKAQDYAKQYKIAFKDLEKTPARPTNLSAEGVGVDKILISWNKVTGADGYRLYRKSGSTWKKLKDLTDTSYTDTGLDYRTTYTYTVRAYIGSSFSDYDKAGVTAAPDMEESSSDNSNNEDSQEPVENPCGKNLDWILNEDGTLRIYGSGDMWDNPSWLEEEDKEQIKKVLIDGEMTSIGKNAFSGCVNLQSITIPKTVTKIGTDAFKGCKNLTITAYIGSFAETYAKNQGISVKSIYVASGSCGTNVTFTLDAKGTMTISGKGAITDHSRYDADEIRTTIKKVIINNGVTAIGKSAFNFCEYMKEISIPDSVTSIGDYAFADCFALKQITLPGKLKSIGKNAFINDYFTKTLTIPATVTSIDSTAFEATGIVSFSVAEKNTKYSSQDGVLFNKAKTELLCYPSSNTRTSYEIPKSVTKIANQAFEAIEKLTSVTLPSNVATIGKDAFRYCYALKTVTIQNKNASIGTNVFKDCGQLTLYGYAGSTTEKYASANKITFKALVVLKQPQNLKAASAGYNSVKITWDKVSNAAGYRVYRKTAGTSWKQVKAVTTNSYVDTGLTTGTVYTYTVRAYKGSTLSSYDKTGKSATPVLSTPKLTRIAASSKKVVIQWEKVAGATGYRVFRKTAGGSWTTLSTIRKGNVLSYTDKTAKKGTTYYYTVRAYVPNGKINSWSSYNKTGLKVTAK